MLSIPLPNNLIIERGAAELARQLIGRHQEPVSATNHSSDWDLKLTNTHFTTEYSCDIFQTDVLL